MRIGVCTTDFQRATADEIFKKAAGYGFECVQLALDSVSECGFEADKRCEIPARVPREAIAAIRAASARYGLPVAAMNGTYNMSHPDPAVRAEGLARFPGFLDAALALDCPIVTLCSGSRNPDHLWRPHPDNGTEDAWRDMLESMAAASRIAEEKGVTLAIETEAANVIRTPALAAKALASVGSPRLKMILDCANLFLPGQARPWNARASLDDAFYWFGADIALAHGKDIRPGSDIAFCPTGEGMVDFPHALRLLKAYRFSGDMVLHGIFSDSLFAGCQRYMRRLTEEI